MSVILWLINANISALGSYQSMLAIMNWLSYSEPEKKYCWNNNSQLNTKKCKRITIKTDASAFFNTSVKRVVLVCLRALKKTQTKIKTILFILMFQSWEQMRNLNLISILRNPFLCNNLYIDTCWLVPVFPQETFEYPKLLFTRCWDFNPISKHTWDSRWVNC